MNSSSLDQAPTSHAMAHLDEITRLQVEIAQEHLDKMQRLSGSPSASVAGSVNKGKRHAKVDDYEAMDHEFKVSVHLSPFSFSSHLNCYKARREATQSIMHKVYTPLSLPQVN